jgi:hypothetical protein
VFDELAQRAKDLARTAEHRAEVHEQLPAHPLSCPDHAERKRMLAAARVAAQASTLTAEQIAKLDNLTPAAGDHHNEAQAAHLPPFPRGAAVGRV